ncbi:hypothetical protein GCM10017673_55060 [Streptosporangium violaceochromogenes]|nr:hypothetical protein GCM10017673_55060 [Streptosporangium violaceochromogenes]
MQPAHFAASAYTGRVNLTADDVADLGLGAVLLGSGGGGRTTAAERLLRRILRTRGPLRVTAAADLPATDSVACVGAVGSSTVMVERLPGGEEFARAARFLERHLARPLAAVQPLEIGGVNGLLGVAAAAWLDLPLVDGDAMGRAFPRLDQTVLAGGPGPAVAALSDPTGNVVVLECRDDASVERVVRAALPALGTWAAVALHHGDAGWYAQNSIAGSVSRALTLGSLLRRAHDDPGRREEFLRAAGASVIFHGRVLQVLRDRAADHIGGTASIQHAAEPARTLRLEFANEYILALDDGLVTARVPDVICVLDARTWRAVAVEDIVAQQVVEVLRLPAPGEWTHPARRRQVDLESYGLAMIDQEPGG